MGWGGSSIWWIGDEAESRSIWASQEEKEEVKREESEHELRLLNIKIDDANKRI